MEMQSTPLHSSLLSRYSDAGQFGEWRDRRSLLCSSVASDASSPLLLSRLADSLVEDTSRLSLETLETSSFSGETPHVSDQELKIRDVLIEKMKEHEARTQQLRGAQKQTTSMPKDFKKSLLFEAENDDLMILDDNENYFSLNDNTPASQEAEIWIDDNLEVTSAGSEPTTENYQQLTPNTVATGDKAEGYPFSRLIPERGFVSPVGKMVGDHDDIFCQSIFHGDAQCHKDREDVDEAVTALESQTSEVGTTDNHELNGASFTAPARPPSPEFDIELPEAKVSLPGNITAEYSPISEADDCLRDEGELEARNTNCAVIASAEVSADEDGGFLSVLSEAAAYHASLKHATGESFDRGDSVKVTENIAMHSECSQDASHYACGSPVVSSVCKERDGTEMHLEPPLQCEAFGELREERRGQKECPRGDLGKIGTDDDDGSSPYVVQESSVLDSSLGSHVGSWGREMDASSDLNDSDKRKMGGLKKLESCSDEDECHDSLEEIELLLKFGMAYMMSANEEQCLSMTGKKQSLGDSVSAPIKPLREMLEFEDIGEAVDQMESHRHLADGTEMSCEDRSAVAVEACLSSVSDHNSVPSSHCGKTAGDEGENWCVRPQTMSARKPRSKLQAVVSPTVKSKKPSAFKTPGKPVFAGTPFQKLLPPRSVKKSPLKPIVTASPCRRPVNYSNIVSPVGAYIHDTPSPSLVTIVKPKGTMAGRGATVVERQDSLSALKVGITCMRLTVRSLCSLPRLWLLSP
jgi:hypothetical protein